MIAILSASSQWEGRSVSHHAAFHISFLQAKAEGIVTYVSNLYDTYFEGGKEHRLDKPSITHVPYFEGDYWPGEAENLLANLGEEQRQAGKSSSKGGQAAVV